MTTSAGTTGPPTTAAVAAPQATAGRQTMRAIMQRRYGCADVLHLEKVDRLTIGTTRC
jgi:hypothetical protein